MTRVEDQKRKIAQLDECIRLVEQGRWRVGLDTTDLCMRRWRDERARLQRVVAEGRNRA